MDGEHHLIKGQISNVQLDSTGKPDYCWSSLKASSRAKRGRTKFFPLSCPGVTSISLPRLKSWDGFNHCFAGRKRKPVQSSSGPQSISFLSLSMYFLGRQPFSSPNFCIPAYIALFYPQELLLSSRVAISAFSDVRYVSARRISSWVCLSAINWAKTRIASVTEMASSF